MAIAVLVVCLVLAAVFAFASPAFELHDLWTNRQSKMRRNLDERLDENLRRARADEPEPIVIDTCVRCGHFQTYSTHDLSKGGHEFVPYERRA